VEQNFHSILLFYVLSPSFMLLLANYTCPFASFFNRWGAQWQQTSWLPRVDMMPCTPFCPIPSCAAIVVTAYVRSSLLHSMLVVLLWFLRGILAASMWPSLTRFSQQCLWPNCSLLWDIQSHPTGKMKYHWQQFCCSNFWAHFDAHVLYLYFRLQIGDDTASHMLESAVCHCNAYNVTLPTTHGKAPYRSLEQKNISERV